MADTRSMKKQNGVHALTTRAFVVAFRTRRHFPYSFNNSILIHIRIITPPSQASMYWIKKSDVDAKGEVEGVVFGEVERGLGGSVVWTCSSRRALRVVLVQCKEREEAYELLDSSFDLLKISIGDWTYENVGRSGRKKTRKLRAVFIARPWMPWGI
jgi:hypothetical protein